MALINQLLKFPDSPAPSSWSLAISLQRSMLATEQSPLHSIRFRGQIVCSHGATLPVSAEGRALSISVKMASRTCGFSCGQASAM